VGGTEGRRATLWVIRVLQRVLAGLVVTPLAGAGSAAGQTVAQAQGQVAWVDVSVATVWIHPTSPRKLDDPVLVRPARVGQWLDSMGIAGRLGLHGRIDTQMIFGTKVVVLFRHGNWSDVEIPSQTGNHFPNGVIGWVPSAQLTVKAPPDAVREVIVSVPSTLLYAESRGVIRGPQLLLSYGTELPELASDHGYDLVGLPGGNEGAIASGALAPVRAGPVPGEPVTGERTTGERITGERTTGESVVAQARLFLGLPYLWGGTSGFGYDCSGLVYSVFARYGILLPRDAADQERATKSVPLAKVRPGDLLFFAGPRGTGEVEHVSIYAGDGLMVDAPYTGAYVEEIPMRSSPAWRDFAGAGRVPGVD
jgi:gamma-D-glutamyl-L-lysine dipeptidyl-peptidase